nr:hypothetical protein [Tanacetum cinerariifolium]
PVLSTKEPKDFLIMGDEHLDTIPENELDEFIKSSIKNLVPSLSESEDKSDESLLNRNTSIDSTSKIDSLLDEFANELILLKLIPSGIDEADCDPEEDIHLVERLFNDSPSLPKNESIHFDVLSSHRPPAKPLDDEIYFEPNTRVLTIKVVGDISEYYVLMSRLFPTQPTLSSNGDKYPHLLSHRGFKALKLFSESPMMIYGGNIPILDVPFLHFYPL